MTTDADLQRLSRDLGAQLERERQMPAIDAERERVARVRRMLAVVESWQPPESGAAGADAGADLDPQPSDTIRRRVGGSGA